MKKTTAAQHHPIRVTLWDVTDKKFLQGFSKKEVEFIQNEIKSKKDKFTIQHFGDTRFYYFVDVKDKSHSAMEKWRVKGNELLQWAVANKWESIQLESQGVDENITYAFAEGIALGNYKYTKHFSDKSKKEAGVKHLFIQDTHLSESQQRKLFSLVNANHLTRDLINEPSSHQSAEEFSAQMIKAGKEAGFSVKVLHKKQIETLKMGGLLAVNKGSIEPPTFTIMEYKGPKAKNKQPMVFVGKGVVFDTGGLSLKPTPGSMDEMKCDMSGAAAVVGLMHAIASNKLPLHVIGLVPATDNRPGMNAVAPQDVITISDGTTIEVMNTDAEGRLILADALVYAKKYKPELVIDLATLTGAAVRAVGTYASAVMGTASSEVMKSLSDAGNAVWERTMEFPLWSDYGDELKSDVADMKNLGGGNAGHISAAKFLQHFTDYPWVHIDIAGTAWNNGSQAYRSKGGTGVGVRMLYQFLEHYYVSK
jgi:leucyl aminopeptidase